MKKDPRPMRTRLRKNLASPDNMLSKGKEDPQALVESQKNKVSQNRITRSRRKEEIISPEKQASQGSRSCEGENVSQTQDVQGPSRRIEEISDAEEESVPLPGSSGASGDKTKSSKTLKSSHPTHKTVRKRRKRSVDSFAKLLGLSRHSPEYNPFQNGQKIIVPSEDDGGGDKTKSFKTLKSSHPTHKTVRKRRKRSVNSFAKFLALSRHSPEYNPFQNGQKIIVPSEDDGVLRRSKRIRVKPLDYWNGERCLYKPTTHGPDFLRISSPP